MADFAQSWQAADKVVYSPTTAATVPTTTSDLSVGGPSLAAHAFRAGLIDECHLFVYPIVVGGGKRSLSDGVRVDLELLDERRLGNGAVHPRYRTSP